MRKVKTLFSPFSLLTISILFTIISCTERDGTVNCFPQQIINAQILLNGYSKIITQEWDYTKGEIGTGTRGLIIYKLGDRYIVYDRNAPHLCPDASTTLEVIKDNDGFLKIYCPKDGAKWILQNGEPNNSQATGIPKKYPYHFDASINALNIYN